MLVQLEDITNQWSWQTQSTRWQKRIYRFIDTLDRYLLLFPTSEKINEISKQSEKPTLKIYDEFLNNDRTCFFIFVSGFRFTRKKQQNLN